MYTCTCTTICTCTFIMCICFIPLSRGDSQIVQQGGVVALLWLDNRVVTPNAQPNQLDTVQRKERDGSRQTVRCPAAMALYNQYMGGVDRNDQLRQYYHVHLKWRQFYKYIFWFHFEVGVANAYILLLHKCMPQK